MGIGDFVSNLFGSSNKYVAQPVQTDPNAFQYGGAPGGAAAAAGAATGQQTGQNARAGAADNMADNQYNAGQVGVGYATQGLDQSQQSRSQQEQALGMAQQRAQGQNLISAQVAQQQTQQLAAQQASAAASARGPGGLAMAQQNAAGNTATGQAQIAQGAGINEAQEQLANQQAFASQAAGLRQGDLSAAGAGTQLANTGYGAAASSLTAGTGAANVGLGYGNLANQVNTTQLSAQENQQQMNSSNANAAQGINSGISGQNAQTNQQGAFGLLGFGSSTAGGIAGGMGGGGKASGGPVKAGVPYLVGEKGPEMVVPQHDGFVIPAGPTAALRRHQASDANMKDQVQPLTPGGIVASTWGTGPGTNVDEAAQQAEGQRWAAVNDASDRQVVADTMAGKTTAANAPNTVAINKRNKDTIAAADRMRALGIAPERVDYKYGDAEARSRDVEALQAEANERQARAGLGEQARKDAAGQPATAAAASAPKKSTLSNVLGDAGGQLSKLGGGIDTGFHPAGAGYIPPTLLQAPPSATLSDDSTKFSFGSVGGAPEGAGAASGVSASASPTKQISQWATTAMSHPGMYDGGDSMGPSMLSDVHAKEAAGRQGYLLGRAHAMEESKTGQPVPFAYGGAPKAGEDIVDMDPSAAKPHTSAPLGRASSGITVQRISPEGQRAAVAGQEAAQQVAHNAASGIPAALMTGQVPLAAGLALGAGTIQHSLGIGDVLGAQPPPTATTSDARAKAALTAEEPMASANRSQKGFSYAYKPGFTPPEQEQGERNVGPIAQNMAADPVAATAVKRDDKSGMLMLDNAKLAKLHSASIASLQDQVDTLHGALSRVLRKAG